MHRGGNDVPGHKRLDVGLDVALQGTGAVDGIEALLDHIGQSVLRQGDGQLAVRKTRVEALEHEVHDPADLFAGERLVVDNLINTVQELGAEMRLQQTVHLGPGFLGDIPVGNAVQDIFTAQIARHDKDGVLEVHGAALTVGDPAVIQHLQEHVEHVGMRLFHLIKEHDGIGMTAHGFGQLAAFIIAHISWRCPDETGYGEFLHVLGHIDPDHVLFIIEQGLGQGLGQFGLAHAGRSEEQEGTKRTVGVLDAGTGAENGLGNLAHGFVLADDPLMQRVFQVQKLFALALHELADRNAGPAAHDTGNFLFRDTVVQQAVLAAGFLRRGFLLGQLLAESGEFAVLELGCPVQVIGAFGLFNLRIGLLDLLAQVVDLGDGFLLGFPAGLHGIEGVTALSQFLLHFMQVLLGELVVVLLQGGFLDFQLHDPAAHIIQLCGQGIDLRADHGAGFIHKVNGLVGEETVRDIPVGQCGGGDQGVVLDLDAVEDLVTVLETAQDGHRVLHRGLTHKHGLEPALKGGILFNVFAVFVQGCGTDAVQFAAGQHGLEQVAGVHGALCFAGSDNGVQLIDEEDDPAFALLDLRQHGLQTLLELAAELGACDKGAHVQGEDGAVLQAVRHVAAHNTLGQAFRNGRLADTGLADKHRIVLGFPGENTDDVPDFAVTADDGVQLLVPGHVHQVGTVFLQGVIGFLRIVGGDAGCAAHIAQDLEECGILVAEIIEDVFHPVIGLVTDAHPQMLHGCVLILHLLGSVFRLQHGLVQFLGNIDLVRFTAGTGDPGNPAQRVSERSVQAVRGIAALGQQLTDQSVRVFQKRFCQMLFVHLHVLIFCRNLPGAGDGLHRFLRKMIHACHRNQLLWDWGWKVN